MRIRFVEAQDFPAIAALTNGYIEKTAVHFGAVPVTAGELCADWEQSRDRYAYLVAEEGDGGGALAGFAKASQFRARAAYQWTVEIGVYVDDAFHRRGVATALYERLIAICARQGFHLVVAGITLPNEASVKLHEKLGFRTIGVFPEVGYKFGAFHDVAFMTKALSASTATPAPLLAPHEVHA